MKYQTPYIMNHDQVLLVTGGSGGSETNSNDMDSTETTVYPGGSWTTLTTANLPSPRNGLSAHTLNNKVLIFGMKSLSTIEPQYQCSIPYS